MNTTYNEQVMKCFHKVNELYYGTINKLHNLFYSTEITTNETFTLREFMKQEDILSFVEEMEKGIRDHGEGGHWTVVHTNTLPQTSRLIK